MLACFERLVPDNPEEASSNDGCDIAADLRAVGLAHCLVDAHTPSYSRDFGGTCSDSHVPSAVLKPTSAEEVSRAIHVALASPSLTLAPRGNGHSISGQAMVVDGHGMVIDMSGLSGVEIDLSSSSAWVGAGALWEDVLARAVEACKMAPRSWTDYLGLTVGGTLSNGGVSGQSFKFGPQSSNVTELEVVTGRGEIVLCSETRNEDLFFGVLCGLGQFGVITHARIPLQPAPDMVRWMRLVYVDFKDYVSDVEELVSREIDAFDYVEGFAVVNSDDPVNGYNLVPFSPDQAFDPARIPPESGPVLYCLELVLHHHTIHTLPTADADASQSDPSSRAEEMIGGLRYVKDLKFAADVSYVDFLTRVKHAEMAARADGTWDAPHPWLNLLVSRADIVDFDLNVFKKILRRGIGGPMLVYPLLKSKWDPRTSVATPANEIFYLVALLRFSRPFPDGRPVEELIAENQEIVDHCEKSGYDFKLYLPHFRSEDRWKKHFGDRWMRFVERKNRYDPKAILAPGQRIFPRQADGLVTRVITDVDGEN